MKKIRIIVCILLFACLITSCGKKNNNKNPNQNDSKLPEASQEFVDYVNGIIIDLNAKEKIDRAFEMYNSLDDDSWNYDEVLNAYDELSEYEAQYNTLLNDTNAADNFIDKVQKIPAGLTLTDEYLIITARNAYDSMSDKAKLLLGVEYNLNLLIKRENEMKELKQSAESGALKEEAKDFLNACATLKNVEQITLDDKETLDNCQELYEKLSTAAKALESVTKAYEELTKCIERYNYLLEHPEIIEDVNRENFIDAAELISSVITLDDVISIKNAEHAYDNLTDEQKQDQKIAELYEKVVAARKEYDRLYFAELEKEENAKIDQECMAFLALANAVAAPITSGSGPALKAAETAYIKLSDKAKARENVKTAYTTLCGYLEDFDKLEDVTRVTIDLYNILSGGPTRLSVVLQGANNVLYKGLKDLYGVSSNVTLAEKCNLYLVFYKVTTNELLFEGDITSALKASSEDVDASIIINLLQAASATNKEVVSGYYYFGLKVKDLTGQYRDSEIFVPTSGSRFNYTFTSLWQDETTEKETIKISTLEDLLNIKNNLNGNYELVNDIDVSSIEWTNLGNLNGTLNGNGHAIIGLNCSVGPKDAFGLFLELSASAVVENLVIKGNVENAGTYAGLVCVRNRGKIRNCFFNVTMKSLGETTETGNTGDACIGGVVCENFGTISNVIVISKIEGAGTQWGQLDGGICVGQYGKVENSYCVIDNVSTNRVVGNDEAGLPECGKTYDELLDKSLYDNFNRYVWEIIDGYLPKLRITEE